MANDLQHILSSDLFAVTAWSTDLRWILSPNSGQQENRPWLIRNRSHGHRKRWKHTVFATSALGVQRIRHNILAKGIRNHWWSTLIHNNRWISKTVTWAKVSERRVYNRSRRHFLSEGSDNQQVRPWPDNLSQPLNPAIAAWKQL